MSSCLGFCFFDTLTSSPCRCKAGLEHLEIFCPTLNLFRGFEHFFHLYTLNYRPVKAEYLEINFCVFTAAQRLVLLCCRFFFSFFFRLLLFSHGFFISFALRVHLTDALTNSDNFETLWFFFWIFWICSEISEFFLKFLKLFLKFLIFFWNFWFFKKKN